MKRLVLLLFALVLVIDLADDGCLAKARFVSPHASVKVSVASSHHGGAGKLDAPGALQPAEGRGPPGQGLRQPVIPWVQQTLKLINFCRRAVPAVSPCSEPSIPPLFPCCQDFLTDKSLDIMVGSYRPWQGRPSENGSDTRERVTSSKTEDRCHG